MSCRERQLWTEFVRKREEREDDKRARKRRSKKPQPSTAELEAALMISLKRSRNPVSGSLAFSFRGPRLERARRRVRDRLSVRISLCVAVGAVLVARLAWCAPTVLVWWTAAVGLGHATPPATRILWPPYARKWRISQVRPPLRVMHRD
jgi:hypothetical protein